MATDQERFLAKRVQALERELDIEKKKSIESHKALCKKERLIKELTLKAEHDKQTIKESQVLLDDLQSTLKIQKNKIQEIETISNYNVDRFRKVHKMYLDESGRSEKIRQELKRINANGKTTLFAQA